MYLLKKCFSLFLLLSYFAPLCANDSITIKLIQGLPVPNQSMEYCSIKIERFAIEKSKQNVDILFKDLKNIIISEKLPKNWYTVGIDIPGVQVIINIDGTTYDLSGIYFNGRLSNTFPIGSQDWQISNAVSKILFRVRQYLILLIQPPPGA